MAKLSGLIVQIPDGSLIELRHLVLDFNGTLARDGTLIRHVDIKLRRLQKIMTVDVLTADTFGTAKRALFRSDIPMVAIRDGADKAKYVERLGTRHVVAIGNGNNDHLMLSHARLSICVLGPEGAAGKSLAASMLIMPSIGAALDALLNPNRLIAGLRD